MFCYGIFTRAQFFSYTIFLSERKRWRQVTTGSSFADGWRNEVFHQYQNVLEAAKTDAIQLQCVNYLTSL